jgi:hypothetical protein
MKAVIAVAIVFSVLDAASAEPVLMLNEPRDVEMAKYSCSWAEQEIEADQYLIKAFKCGENELCQRAVHINAACKVGGPVRDVKGFHSKLLAQLAGNSQSLLDSSK